MLPPSSGSKNKPRNKPAWSSYAACFSWFLDWITLLFCRLRRHAPPKRRLTINGLDGIRSHKIEIFITTAVRTPRIYEVLLYCENHIKHINTLFVEDAELVGFKADGAHSNHCALRQSCERCFRVQPLTAFKPYPGILIFYLNTARQIMRWFPWYYLGAFCRKRDIYVRSLDASNQINS
jgi:hypothetical protein